jgi:hypothetical protein
MFFVVNNTTTALTILSSGNVGIGETNPTAPLYITNSAAQITLNSTGAGQDKRIYFRDSFGSGLSYITSSSTLYFGAGGFSRIDMTLANATGNLLIGTTTDAGYKLSVNGVGNFSSSVQVKKDGSNSASDALTLVNAAGNRYFNWQLDANGNLAGWRYSGSGFFKFLDVDYANGDATFANSVNIGNSVASGVAVASTHKVSILINGVQYYLLASNV